MRQKIRYLYTNPSVPDEVISDFNEAQICFECGVLTASVLMCRRVLSSIAINKGVKRDSLKNQIKDLHKNNVIPDKIFNLANQIRDIGNVAAHPEMQLLDGITPEDAEYIIKFTNSVIQYVYFNNEMVLPDYSKIASLQQFRRTAKLLFRETCEE